MSLTPLRVLPWLLACGLSGMAAPVFSATPQDPISPRVEQAVQNVKTFATGQRYEVPQVSDQLTCEQLYAGIVRLTSQTNSYQPAYWDDPRNAAIFAAGFVVTPAFYALAYTAFDGYGENRRMNDVNMRLDALRQASARKQCWVR